MGCLNSKSSSDVQKGSVPSVQRRASKKIFKNKEDRLRLAAASGNVDELTGLAAQHGDDFLKTPIGEPKTTALHIAAAGGSMYTESKNGESMKFLLTVCEMLNRKCAIDVTDEDGRSPLFYAVRGGDISLRNVQALCYRKCDVDLQDNYGRTALHYAAHSGNIPAIEYLLLSGAEVNIQDKDGFAPIHVAANAMNPDVADALLKATDIDMKLEAKQPHNLDAFLKMREQNYSKEQMEKQGKFARGQSNSVTDNPLPNINIFGQSWH